MFANIQATAVAVLTMGILGYVGVQAGTQAVDAFGKATAFSPAPKAQPKGAPVVTVSKDGTVSATFTRQK